MSRLDIIGPKGVRSDHPWPYLPKRSRTSWPRIAQDFIGPNDLPNGSRWP
jgi:hypothetical protein